MTLNHGDRLGRSPRVDRERRPERLSQLPLSLGVRPPAREPPPRRTVPSFDDRGTKALRKPRSLTIRSASSAQDVEHLSRGQEFQVSRHPGCPLRPEREPNVAAFPKREILRFPPELGDRTHR